jgi:carboxypeptidase family protein
MKKWILGVLAPVLSALLIFWLVDAPKEWLFGRGKSQSYQFDGRVIDANQNRLLSNVAVSLEIRGGTTFNDKTDSEGRYLFSLDEPAIALLRAAAQGYKEFTRNIAIDTSRGTQPDIVLAPEPSPPPGPPIVLLPRPGLMEKAPMIRYEPRRSETAIKVRVPRAQ